MSSNRFGRTGLILATLLVVILTIKLMLRPTSGPEHNTSSRDSSPSRNLPAPTEQSSAAAGSSEGTQEEPAADEDALEPHPEALILVGSSGSEGGEATTTRFTHECRILALQRLSTEIPTAETKTILLDYLRQPNRDASSPRPDLFEAAIKNDLIEWFRNSNPPVAELPATLVAMASDPDQPAEIRDYALQHMGPLAARLQVAGQTESDEGVVALESALWNATDSPEHSYAGTALLSLQQLPWLSHERHRQQARRIVESEEFSSLSRATALHLLTEYQPDDGVAIAETFLTPDQPTELRLAAIAVVGDHGREPRLVGLLHNIDDPRFRAAAVTAREQVRQRNTDGVGGEG